MINKEKNRLQEAVASALTNLTKFFGPSETTQEIVQVAKAEEMISYEVVYEPNVKDAHGEWMSTATVQKACEDFNKHLAEGVVQPNLFHTQNTDYFTIEKSWIVPEIDMVVEATGEKVKAGTWVAKIKYNNNDLWTLKKAGVIGGVSIGAKGNVNKETGEITNVSFAPEEIQKAMMQQTSGGTSDPSHMMTVANLSNTGVAPKNPKKGKRKRLVYAP